MAVQVVTIPLNTGCHEETDIRVLSDGRLRTVRNGRLDREGRLRVRAGYTAIHPGTYGSGSADLVAYDLFSFRGRLVALGDRLGKGFATDLFEYVGEAESWRSQATATSYTIPLPRATALRNVANVASAQLSDGCSAAAGGGLVCHAYAGGTSTPTHVLVSKADTDQTLLHDVTLVGVSTHPVALASRFMVPGRLLSGPRVLSAHFIDFTDEDLAAPVGLIDAGLGNTVQIFNSCPVTGADQFCIVAKLSSGAVRVRRFDNAGIEQVPSGLQYADITAAPTWVAVEADIPGNTLNVAMVVAGVVQLFTYNLATGAAIGVGPHTSAGLIALGTATRCELTRNGVNVHVSADVLLTITGSVTIPTVALQTYTPGTNAFDANSLTDVHDASLCSRPIVHAGEIVFASNYGGVAAQNIGPLVLLSVVLNDVTSGPDNNRVVPLTQVDLEISFGSVGQLALDSSTSKYYWARNGDNGSLVTEFELGSTERRQMVQCGNVLYISGGLPLAYDGRDLVEMGFIGRPRFLDLSANGSGSLDNNTEYTYETYLEAVDADDNTIRGAVSVPGTETTGTTDQITAYWTCAHSLRGNANSEGHGNLFSGKLYRNTVDVVDAVNVPSALLQFVGRDNHSHTLATGAALSFNDAASDDSILDEEVIYTQVQTPLDNHAPVPCKYMAYGNDRMFVAGLPQADRWQVSKPLQPAEQIAFAQDGVLAFSGRVRGDIEAVLCSSQSTLFITRKELWLMNGSGPNLNGQGEFQAAYRVPSDGGMQRNGWRSVVEFGQGTMFQLADDQLYLWNGGVPVAVGLEIQDTMLEFPVVVAACHIVGQQSIALALQTEDGTGGCIVLWDQQTKQWFRDDVGAVSSLAEYDGRLAYVKAGVVYLEDEDYGTGTAVELSLKTGNVAKSGVAGAGGCQRILATGAWRGDCTFELRISYDDQQTFDTLGTQSLLAADGYSLGDPIDLEWAPNRDDVSRFALELVVSSASANTQLAWLVALEAHYEADDGPKRLGDSRRR